jgi:hypothetical protein
LKYRGHLENISRKSPQHGHSARNQLTGYRELFDRCHQRR